MILDIPINGHRGYHYSDKEIYDIIIDLPELIMEFPIIQKVESPRPDTFEVTIELDMKLYSGQYTLEIVIIDKQPHKSLTLRGYHKSRVGTLKIDVVANIQQDNNQNKLDITGTFNVGGMMKYAGRKTLSNGVAMGMSLMFDYLEKKLNEDTDIKAAV